MHSVVLTYNTTEYIRIQKGAIIMRTTTIRLSDETLSRVDTMADRLNRSRSWVINQAVDSYLSHEEWLVKEIHDGLTDLKQNDLATDDDIRRHLIKWGIDAD